VYFRVCPWPLSVFLGWLIRLFSGAFARDGDVDFLWPRSTILQRARIVLSRRRDGGVILKQTELDDAIHDSGQGDEGFGSGSNAR
jgi:hypothetical protein